LYRVVTRIPGVYYTLTEKNRPCAGVAASFEQSEDGFGEFREM